MRPTSWILATFCLAITSFAQTIQTIDLKPFVGPSQIEAANAEWLVPHGRQVLDGVPFQIDGAILLYSTSWMQKSKPARTNVNDIPVSQKFEQLHLLAAAQQGTDETPVLGRVRLNYEDGSTNAIDIVFGTHMRGWYGGLHKKEPKLKDSASKIAWRGLHAAAARFDCYMRLYHVPLTNPEPGKEVKSLSLESAKGPIGLMVAAISVGPANAPRMEDTVPSLKTPIPDVKPRSSDVAQLHGSARDAQGGAISDVVVKVAGVRPLNTSEDRFVMPSAEIAKETKTAADGSFALSLPGNQLYRLLFVRRGFEPAFYPGADPKLDPIEIRLSPPTNKTQNFKFSVRAKVLGPDEKPLGYAIIEREGVGYQGGMSWGSSEGMPEQLVADENGEFLLGRDKPFNRVQVRVHAGGLADGHEWLDVTNAVQTIKMNVGGTIRGRVIKDGQPVPKVSVGLTASERSSEEFAGHFETETDTNGVFQFEHMQSHTAWYLHGKAESVKKYGALPFKSVRTGAAGETNDIDNFIVEPALHVAGRVQTSNGEPLPKGLKVSFGYSKGWDSQTVSVADDGSFRADGLTSEEVEIWFQHDKWRLSVANPAMTGWNPGQLMGKLESSKDNFLIIIEPGKREYGSSWNGNGELPDEDQARNRNLTGAEVGLVTLSGRVIDDETGQLVRKLKVVPGRKKPFIATAQPKKGLLKTMVEPLVGRNPTRAELPHWYAETQDITNGQFSVAFAYGFRAVPLLRIEAEGYDPLETEPSGASTNLVVRLKHGKGPQGIVLLPDGTPAADAVVVYGGTQEQFVLRTNNIDTYGTFKFRVSTGKDGKFSFAPRSTGRKIFAAHPRGWAEETAHSDEDLKIRLQPWAAVTGVLVQKDGKPATGVELQILIPHDWNSGDPSLNTYDFKVVTDGKGQFRFPAVPAQRLELQRIVPSGAHSWSYTLQTWFVAKPGITNDLGNVTYDTPPPPPLVDQLKQKLGF